MSAITEQYVATNWGGLLEPGTPVINARKPWVCTPEAAAQFSIAMSLKRIADAMAKMTTEPCNEYGEPLHAAIANGISRGLQGGIR